MKTRKIIAWIMLCIFVIGQVPIYARPNTNQRPIRNLNILEVLNERINDDEDIMPVINVEWYRPQVIEPEDMLAEFYQFRVKDIYWGDPSQPLWSTKFEDNREVVSADAGDRYYSTNIDAGEAARDRLQSGRLYELSVIPGHTIRWEDNNGNWYREDIRPTTEALFEFVLTDLNTKMRDEQGELVVRWEYVPGAEYRLTYIEANENTKQDINGNNNTASISVTLNENQVQELLVEERGVTYVEYTIERVTPGQIYSAYVEVIDIDPSYSGIEFREIKVNKNTDEKGPKVVKAIPSIGIEIREIDTNLLRISWDGISTGDYTGQVTLLARGESGQVFEPKVIMDFSPTNTVNTIVIEKPDEPTEYRLDFEYMIGDELFELSSNTVWYIPDLEQERPSKPVLPKPWGPNIDFNNPEINREDYLLTGDIHPNNTPANNPNFRDNTFHVRLEDDGTSIQLVWEIPTLEGEQDYQLYYDIWVSDDYGKISQELALTPVVEDLVIRNNQSENIVYSYANNEPVGFKVLLEEYRDASDNLKMISSNKTYYIKIQAKRKYDTGELKSITETVAITIDKNGDIFQPPVMGKPPLQIDDVTTNEITFKWLEEWYEILAKDISRYTGDEQILAQIGSARVYVGAQVSPYIRYKYQEGFDEKILLDRSDVNEVIDYINNLTEDNMHYETNYFDRQMTLGEDIQYEMNVLPYKEVEDEIDRVGIENWVLSSRGLDGWRDITPNEYTDNTGREWKDYTITGLEANTRYIVLLSAYRVLDDGTIQQQTFPTYLLATTLSDHEGQPPIPTVPTLHLYDVTDTNVAVWWTYNSDFDYEIVYSTTDDPDTANVWDFDLSNDVEDGNYVAEDGRAIVTIRGLFPETTYNVWIRAKQVEGSEVSAWSNPVRATTDELATPQIPRGLGSASKQTMIELGRDEEPVGEDYITVEWIRNTDDVGDREEEGLVIRYEYDLMFANNMEFLDPVTVTISEQNIGSSAALYEVLDKQVVQFKELRAYYPHYVKVKARIILEDTASNRELSKESEYSSWVRILTERSDGEYDGGGNDNIVIYPDDIEESLKDGVWTWEIVNANGIITKVLQDGKYFMDISVERYADRYSANTRLIRIPVSVMTALSNQNMSIRIFTEVGKYEVQPAAINYYIQGAGSSDIVEIRIDQLRPSDMLTTAKSYPYMYQKGEMLSFRVDSSQKVYEPLQRLDLPIKVGLKVDNPYTTQNVQSYLLNQSTGSWEYRQDTMEQVGETTYLSYTTYDLGVYSLYTIHDQVVSTQTTYEMQQIKDRYNVIGLGNEYGSYDIVHSDQFITLLLGIATKQSEINLEQYVGENQMEMARQSEIYVASRGYITEEQALSGLVRLYEMSTGYPVKTNAPVNTQVSSQYRENVQKAYTLGIGTDINPGKNISYATLCSWLVEIGF